jgi:tetratricopeptide (TPR) repeat protein
MRWRELAEVLEKEAHAEASPEPQAQFYRRLGELRAGELMDLDGALAAFKSGLELEPQLAGARAGMEKLLASPAHAEAALDVLEPLYETDGAHEKLLELGEVRLGVTSGAAAKAQLLEQLANRAEQQLDDPARALEAMARALALEPDEPRFADEVERLGRAAGLDARAASALEDVLAAGVARETQRELGLRAARIWDALASHDPSQQARAERRYVAVLDAEPANLEALEALDRIYRGRGDAQPLVAILERRAQEELDLAQKKRLYAEAAQLSDRALHNADEATRLWRKLLEVDEADPAALDALAHLYEAGGHYAELVELCEQKARFEEDPAAQIGLKSRIAALYAERLNDLDKAVQAYRDLIDLAPDSLSALEALEELETRRGDFMAVQEVLVRRLQAVGRGAPQIPVYRKLARLAVEKQGSPEDAMGYIHEILALAPEDEQAERELIELLERTEKFHDLVDVLTEQANQRARRGDSSAEVALLVRAADVYEQKLGSADAATEILERILERDPNNVRALTSLAHIYEAAHDVERCRATLEKAIGLASSGPERAELHFRIGRLASDDGGDEAGEPHFAQALDADPGHVGAEEALERIARARGDWARVAELLVLRERRVPEAEKRALSVEIAQVYGQKLGRPQEALPYLERAVKSQPDDPQVIEPLADLYFAAGRLDEAAPLYRTLAERMQKARRMKDVARLRQRIGAIAEQRGDLKTALTDYTQAHQIDPGHTATLAALGRLYMATADYEKARGTYKKMLLANLDPQGGVTKADVYLALGEIHEKLGEAPKAVGMYERGLELDGSSQKLRSALARVKK